MGIAYEVYSDGIYYSNSVNMIRVNKIEDVTKSIEKDNLFAHIVVSLVD